MFRQNLTIKQSFDVSVDKINMGLKRTGLKGLCHAYFRQFHDTSDAHHENLKIKHHNSHLQVKNNIKNYNKAKEMKCYQLL